MLLLNLLDTNTMVMKYSMTKILTHIKYVTKVKIKTYIFFLLSNISVLTNSSGLGNG